MINIIKYIEHFETITSTHKFAKENINNYKNGTVIIADEQTDGIGTNQRKWHTGFKNNIAMTVILKPNITVIQLENLTIDIAKAIQKVIKELYNYSLDIKAPNDLILNGKKISGILTEVSSIGEKVNYILISIGFNVNEEEFPEEIRDIATSLKREYKKNFDKEEIIFKIIEELNCLLLKLTVQTNRRKRAKNI